jgi:M6 family metalloprotease-like protein
MIEKNFSSCKLAFVSQMLLLLTFANAVLAAPIRNHPTSITQPDGQVIKCFVTGDEYYHWLHDENDYTIIRNDTDNWYYYAVEEDDKLKPSEYKVGSVNPLKTNLEPGARFSTSKILEQRNLMSRGRKSTNSVGAKNAGTLNSIVIFVRFADDPEFEDSISVYEKMFNDNAAGSTSMYAYFKEVSYNRMFVKTHFYPKAKNGMVVSYSDNKPRSYYLKKTSQNPDGYTAQNIGNRRAELYYKAVTSIQNEISEELNLDFNNNGIIDNVNFIVKGDIDPEWLSLLWPNANVYNDGASIKSPDIKINGKKFYDCVLEIQISIKESQWGIEHEMFHILGATDLYHYTFDNFYPIGIYDIMQCGNTTPQSMSAYMKFRYGGWIDSIPAITKSGRYYLSPLSSGNNNCYKINSPNSTNFYFVLEYRKRMGTFESILPGDGLMVYRVNRSRVGAGNGDASNLTDELYVYRPGGKTYNKGAISSAPLNNKNGRELINDNTATSCFLPGDKPGGIDISDIKEDGDSISFYVRFEKTPKTNFEVSTLNSDNGKVEFFDNSSQSPYSWIWDFGDGQSSAERNPIHYYTLNDTFDVSLIVKNQYGSDTLIKKALISINRLQQNPENEPAATFCNSGNTTLKAKLSGEGNIVWYNHPYSGKALGTGVTYLVNYLDSTTTFYSATEVSRDTIYYLGAKDTTIGPSSYRRGMDDSNHDIFFDCLSDIILQSVKVYSFSDKERRIQIINQNNVIILDSLVSIPIGEKRLTLNVPIDAGKNYQFLTTSASPDLYFNTNGAAYPYEIPKIISITGSFYGSNVYGYFYDWEVKHANSSSPRTPVTVELIKAKITPRPFVRLCNGNSIELTSSPATTYLWSPGGETTHSIVVADSGMYSVSTLIGDCENISLPVKIAIGATNPQIPVSYTVNGKTVSFKATVIKGFHYVFDFGDLKNKIYDPLMTVSKDTSSISFSHVYSKFGAYNFWQKVTGECGMDSTLLLIPVLATSVENEVFINTLDIFPNPSTGSIQFTSPTSSSRNGTVLLYDFTGRQVFSQNYPFLQAGETVSLDLGQQTKGIYLIRLKFGNEEFSGRVVLVK